MAKTTKPTATTASASPASTTAPASSASVPPTAPVKVVKAKEPKTPKAPKEPVAAVSVAPAADAAASATEEVVAPSTEAVISSQFSSVSAKLQQVVAFAAALRSELRSLERHAIKEIRIAQKASAKKRRKVGNRAPSGFVKPTPISKELAEFLGKTDGSEMARTEVTREINAYIRNNSLQDKENGRRINPDAKLKSLLKLKKGEELTYFNLQRYMSPHFSAKSGVVAVVAGITA
uniref:DM2 domain-containing protein n=1 Tax=viral metagenome TaxID=1070528 RepID=A0A6C0I4W1_9ZZZZ